VNLNTRFGDQMNDSGRSKLVPREGTQLVLLGGLPGSGKTRLARHLERADWLFLDDFQGGAVNDSPHFRDSRHYAALLAALRAGRPCLISDIRVIHDEYRRGAELALRRDLGTIRTELHLFENDPHQCARNVRNAGDDRREKPRLDAIAFWTKLYSAPSSAVIHAVWRPPQDSDPTRS
jgi:hypothetical protein